MVTPEAIDIGRRVTEEMARAGWTVPRLAAELQLSEGVLRKILKGDVSLSMERGHRIAVIIGADANRFFPPKRRRAA